MEPWNKLYTIEGRGYTCLFNVPFKPGGNQEGWEFLLGLVAEVCTLDSQEKEMEKISSRSSWNTQEV